ncbi:TPA: hypothetical protein HL326_23710 [Escherichia coli]|nr:hypothetical protein [Escherichia coli]EFA4458335.1 hypothetical protein [Escherichia coli O153]EFB2600978.1 hypothetical protein [Escherichia coli]EFD1735676.1 hypothetical protein [Escherichia coli]EFH9271416.1 hypothetical protein [Escherichia coli]
MNGGTVKGGKWVGCCYSTVGVTSWCTNVKNNQQDVAGHQPVLLVLPGSAPTAAEITFTGATGFGMLLRQIVSPFQ